MSTDFIQDRGRGPETYHDDRPTTSDVSDYLGVKLKHLDKVSELVGVG